MTVVITYLASDNARNRRRARRAEAQSQIDADARLARKIAVAGSGCSLNVARATSAPSLREKRESTSQCLPQVALYQAGHRKVRKDATHIIK